MRGALKGELGRRILLVSGSLLGGALLLEGGATLYLRLRVDRKVIVLGDRHWDHGHVFDPDLLWRPAPRTVVVEAWPQIDVVTNSLGMRGPETTAAPAPGVFRILVLGESTVFGHGVREEKAWPRVLEGRLREGRPDLPLEVLNGGVRAWTIWQGMRFAERELKHLRPRLLLVSFEGNDGMGTAIRNSDDIRRYMPYTDRELDLLLHGQALATGDFVTRLQRVFFQSTSLGAVLARARSPYAVERVPLADRAEAWSRLLAAARGEGVAVVIVHPLYRYGGSPHPCLLRDIAARERLPLVDLERDVFAEGFDPGEDFLDQAHPRPPLHARFAAIAARGVLPLLPPRGAP